MKPVSDDYWSACPFSGESKDGSSFLLWLLMSYVALVPSLSIVPGLGLYNEKRTLQIGVLVVVAGVLIAWGSVRRQWLSTFMNLPFRAHLGFGTVIGLGLLSSALAPAPFYAILEVSHFVLLFVAAGIVASEVRRMPQQTQWLLLGAVVVSGMLYAVYFTVGYGMHLAVADIKPWPEGGTNYVNIRSFNQYQTWTLPLLSGIIPAVPRRWRSLRVAVFGLVALWWALVFASNVRGTIVAVGLAAVGVGLLFRGRARAWLAVQGGGVIVGLALFYLLFSTGEAPPVSEKFGTGSSTRLQHWRICLKMAWSNPWVGAGPMHFAWPPNQFTEPASPHSALFQWLSEWGIPSTLIMGSLVVWGGWCWMQQEREDAESGSDSSNAVRVALVAAVLAGAAHSMVSGLIVTPISQTLLVFVGGWAWGRYRPAHESTTDFSWSAHVVLCVLIAGAMVVVGSSLSDLSTVEERRLAFRDSVEDNRFSPRYWTQGYIGVRDSTVIERARRDW